ncbi:PKD domain-containing protein [Flavobacteriales bacterium]|nr:PKD domain-containing protein [Flavobacteriales bacterium]
MKTLYTKTSSLVAGLAFGLLCCIGPLLTMAAPGGTPANDLCVDATPIACGDAIAGSNVGATEQAVPTTVGTVGPGVWYVLTGTGGNITLSTCGSATWDSEINVVTSPDCISFTNVAGNDDACGAQSEVTFTSVSGTTYYVYVSDYISGGSNAGAFTLSMSCPPPANNLCADATALDCGDAVSGTTVNADGTGEPTCLGGASPGVWYSFVGDGTDYTIDVTAPGLDPVIVVTSTCGGSCDVLQSGSGSVSATVTATTIGATYYVYVLDNTFNEMPFDLALSSSACETPANDDACDALPIACGDALDGSTNFATVDPSVTTAGRGVWYVFEGNGQDVTLSTCGTATFDTEITVQTGADCNSLSTLTFNDDFTGCSGATSQVTFYAEYGTSYYVHVAHYSATTGTTGDFTLSATCACPTALDAGALTADATPVCLDANGEADLSATESAAPQVPSGYTVTYVLTSGGSNYVIEAVNSTPEFTVTSGGEYTIHTLVSTGTLDLSGVVFGTTAAADVLTIVAGDDNICAALDVTGSGSIIVNAPDAGTLTADATPVCLTGGTATISASVGTAPSVPTGYEIAYVLTDGDSPNLDILDVVLPPAAVASFDVTAGGNYIIHTLVFDPADGATILGETTGVGVATLIGTGAICASLDVAGAPILVEVCTVVPPNDLCGDAQAILCGETLSGTTVNATATAEPAIASGAACGTNLETAPGVWYSWVSDGSDITVTTCDAADFDTKIGIFTGTCGALTCVAGNDDDFDCTGATSTVADVSTVSGETYYFYVTGFLTQTGTFDITLTCVAPPPTPANDNVCDAATLVLGANTGFTNVGATVETDEPLPPATGCVVQDGWCDFESGLNNTIWFTFQGPASGNLTIDTDGSDDDTQIAAYSAVSCQDFTTSGLPVQIAANDDNNDWVTTQYSSILFLCGLTPGETYFLQVDGYDGAAGAVVVNLTEATVDADFTSVATGLSVAFTDASTDAVTYVWDFGDGDVSPDASPTHVYAADGPYTVCLTVTDANGCTSEYCEAIQVTDIPTTIAEAVERGMEVYPNPSNGQFVVKVNGVEADVQIVVMDVAGRQVYNEGVTLNNSFRKELNLDVAKGTYLLQIATVEGLVTRKIQIN